MNYTIGLENFTENYPEIEPLYRIHFEEMRDRMRMHDVPMADYNPRLPQYFAASDGGWLLCYIVRGDGKPVGYSNVYLTNDMHNGELIAQEDTIFVHPDHRNGIGRRLAKFVLADLKKRGVKRLNITAITDSRGVKLWERIGFRHSAYHMTFTF